MKVECGQLFWDNKACELPWKVLLLWLHLPAHASTAEDKSFLKVQKRSNFLSRFCAKEKGKYFVSIAVNVFFYNGIIPRMTTTYSHRLRGIGLFFKLTGSLQVILATHWISCALPKFVWIRSGDSHFLLSLKIFLAISDLFGLMSVKAPRAHLYWPSEFLLCSYYRVRLGFRLPLDGYWPVKIIPHQLQSYRSRSKL